MDHTQRHAHRYASASHRSLSNSRSTSKNCHLRADRSWARPKSCCRLNCGVRFVLLFSASFFACHPVARHGCTNASECAAGEDCVASACVTPSCTDGARNGAESDVDCGGSCSGCVSAHHCLSGSDCQSRNCVLGQCADFSCTDGSQNGNETDVDCGGSRCGPCVTGKHCSAPGDCSTGICSDTLCVSATCSNGTLDGGESDIDCGGSCVPCVPGKNCVRGTDCDSHVCTSRLCVAATCTDTVRNGDEADIDCGGSCIQKCGRNKLCTQGLDCASGTCVAGRCSDCVKDSDCGTSSECQTFTCTPTGCAARALPATTALVQTANDCARRQCDDAGHVVSVLLDDPPPALGTCTASYCLAPLFPALAPTQTEMPQGTCMYQVCSASSQSPQTEPEPAGFACTNGVCDGHGACVRCLTSAQCGGKPCVNHLCASCRANSDCNSGKVCAFDGTGYGCHDCGPSVPCDTGYACVGGTCASCTGNNQCVDATGACITLNGSPAAYACGGYGDACSDCTSWEGGACVYLNGIYACGCAQNVDCANSRRGSLCISGNCGCSSGSDCHTGQHICYQGLCQ